MPILPYIDFTPTPPTALYHVDTFTLSGTDISNGYVTLTGTPTTASATVLQVIGGDVQEYGVDFTMIGNQLNWGSLGLNGVLVSGDILIVQFN